MNPVPIRARGERFVLLFVWGIWAVMFASALTFVAHYGVNVPYFDEWDDMVSRLAGIKPVTLSWLWSAHNEHRLVLSRLIELGLFRADGGDLRPVMHLNVCLM